MSSNARDSTQTVQRVKVGMTGLASVLLLIGLASAVFSWASKEPPVDAVGAAHGNVVADMTANLTGADDDAGREPLAELGVTPSADPGAVNAIDTAPAANPPAQ